MNKVIIMGNLTRDPEVRYTPTGKAVASFSIAVNRFVPKSASNAGGERNTAVDYVPIVAWEHLAENCGNYLTKGSKVLVEGRLQIRDYETTNGEKRRVAEIIAQNIEFLNTKSQSQANYSDAGTGTDNSFKQSAPIPQDDDIPF